MIYFSTWSKRISNVICTVSFDKIFEKFEIRRIVGCAIIFTEIVQHKLVDGTITNCSKLTCSGEVKSFLDFLQRPIILALGGGVLNDAYTRISRRDKQCVFQFCHNRILLKQNRRHAVSAFSYKREFWGCTWTDL